MVFLRTPLSGCLLLLLLLVTAFDQSRAKAIPSLIAANLIPATTPPTAFFAEGESTATLGTGLPSCTIIREAGSYLELYNVDTGFVAGRHGPFDNRPMIGIGVTTTVLWDTATYPVLNASFTGLYICRTDTGNSTTTYHLNVRANLRITCPTSFRVEKGESLTVVVEVSRSLPINATATPEIGSSRIDEPNVTWSVNGNDSGLLLAQNISVTWNVSYVDSTCSGVVGDPGVLANCLANTADNCTTDVLQVKNCSPVNITGISVNITNSSAPGFIHKNVGCRSGFVLSPSSSVRNVQCQLDGTWTAFPNCTARIRLCPPDGLSITRRYSALLPMDQPTKMLPALPACELSYTATSYMELYNLNGSFVAARTDNVNDSVIMKLAWNHVMYPTLNTTLNGRYVCRTDSLTALDPFDLTVLAPPTIKCPPAFRIEINQSLNIDISSAGSLPVHINSTSSIGEKRINRTGVESNLTWSLNGSDQGLVLAENVSVMFTALYENVECSKVRDQPDIFNSCSSIPHSNNCSTEVLQIKSCKLEPFFGGNVVETQEISADAVVHDIRCASGYKTLNQSTDGTIQCKTNGSWTTFPRCEDINECHKPRVCGSGVCTNTFGAYYCECHTLFTGEFYCRPGPILIVIIVIVTIIIIAIILWIILRWYKKHGCKVGVKVEVDVEVEMESRENCDDDLRPTFKSGQRLIRPGGVGYGDGYVPGEEHPHHTEIHVSADIQADIRISMDAEDPSALPGTSEVPMVDNYNTFIRTDLIANPPPTRAPTFPPSRDTYDHIVLDNPGTNIANPSNTYDHVETPALPSGDVYRQVDIRKKTRPRDDDKNEGDGSHIG